MSELRKDPVIDRWVIIASERGKRPVNYQISTIPLYKSVCPFCPGNEEQTPPEIDRFESPEGRWRVRVVPNKYPAVSEHALSCEDSLDLFQCLSGWGMHEVIIETTEHQRQMGDYGTAQMEQVITMYRDRFLHYSRERKLAYIIIFKNEGIQAGATLDHPHTQLIALPVVPQNIREELEASESYHRKKSGCIYCDLVEKEEEQKLRIISVNQHFVSLSAWAARFPFESWIIPRAHQARFENLEDVQIHSLGQILKSTLKRMGSVLGDLSYNFMIHSAPFHISADLYYHWHIKILPRTTNIAGFEYGTGYYINPVPPEEAAEKMRIITFHS